MSRLNRPGWRTLVFWVVMLLLATPLLLLQADTRGIWQDEGLTLYQVQLPFREILQNQIPVAHAMTPNTVPPFFFLLLGVWGRLVGYGLLDLRLFSILCSLLFIGLMGYLGTIVAHSRAGRITALLVALSPVLWWYAQELRMYAFLLIPSALSMIWLWRWYRSNEQREQVLMAVLYALTVAALLWTHYIGFYLVGAQLLWIAFVMYRRHPRLVLAIGGLAGLAAIPLLPFAIQRLTLGAERDYFFMSFPEIAGNAVHALAFGLPFFVSRSEDVWWILPIVWVVLALGVWQAYRQGSWTAVTFLLFSFLLPLVMVSAIGYIKPLYQNVRHVYVAAPAFYLLLTLGLVRLYEIRRLLPVAVVAVFGYAWGLSTLHYFAPDPAHPLKNDVRPLFEAIASRYIPGDTVVLNDPVLQHALEYFAPGVAWEVLPPYGELDPAQRERTYQAVADGSLRVWLVYGPPDTTFDTWEELLEWYTEHMARFEYLEYPGQTKVEAALFDTRPPLIGDEPMPAAYPANVSFGDGIRYLGLAAPLEAPVPAGRRVPLQGLWTVTQQPSLGYSFVVRLTDGAGRNWYQYQALPLNGLHLTDHWLPEQYIRAPLLVPLPNTLPPGSYNISLFLAASDGSPRYDESTGSPTPLTTVEVARPVAPAEPEGEWLTKGLRVEAVNLPSTLPPAPSLDLTLRLSVVRAADMPGAVLLSLRDTTGATVWSQPLDLATGGPLTADGAPQFPPAAWQAGDTTEVQYRVTLPPTAEGDFTLHLAALNGDTPLPAPTWGGLLSQDSVVLDAVTITPRAKNFEVPTITNPVTAEWTNAVRLLGYNTSAPPYLADAPLDLDLVWQAIAPTQSLYKVFLQLLDAEGNFVTGADAFMDVPTTAWQADEIAISHHRFEGGTLAPGTYTVIVGLYNETTGERLAVDAPNAAFPLGELTVE